MDALLREDAASRLRALELASFIVEAPAGAGKTELLTQRVLRLLAVVEEPEEVVAITFTNKAAAEMKARILASLARAAAGDMPEEPHKRITYDLARAALAAGAARGWQLMANPGRLRITTIDALCASLARQLPFLSRFGAQPQLADKAARHYEEATRRTLALVEADDAVGMAVADALRHLDNDAGRLAALLADMLARRDQWLPHTLGERLRDEAERAVAALIRRDLENAAVRFDAALQARLMPLARFAANNVDTTSPLAALLDWTTPLTGTPQELPQWRALCKLLLTEDDGVRKQVNKNQGFPAGKEAAELKAAMGEFLAAVPAAVAAALARVRELPDPHYGEDEWRTVEALSRLLQLAAAQLWTVFNEAGEADFVEVAQRALQALGKPDAPTDLALALDYRIRHLLVDEFQDTSPTQVELLRRLTAGWTAGDGRTLFAVGDPMQSIYRFRKADVGLFLRAAEQGIGGLSLERLRLTRNNRSCAAVVDWVNVAFAGIFPAADGVAAGAIRYRTFVATRDPLPGAGVVVAPVLVTAQTPPAQADAVEAQRIVDIIRKVRRDDPQRRIAVLVRARGHLDALVAEIRRRHAGLRFQAVEIEGLAERQPVQDMLSLTRALHHRADRVHWLAILRAPWCGLTLADLHALAGDDHRRTLWQLMNEEDRVARLSADGQVRLLHLRSVIEEAFAQRGRQRPRRWVEGVWLRLGGAACLAGGTDAADVGAFLDLIDRLDGGGRFGIEELEREVADLYAAPDPAAGDDIQFMTIHKSKGLEFDTVILPGLHRGTGNGDQPLMLWEEVLTDGAGESLVAAPLKRRGAADGTPTLYDYLRRLEAERSANEDARVLYVAATRAIRALHLVGVVAPRADGTLAARAGTFLGLLWGAVAGEFDAAAASAEEGAAIPAAAAFTPQLVRCAAPAAPAALLQAAALPPAMPRVDAEAAEFVTGDPLAAHVGTLVHIYLEMIARSGVPAWPEQRIRALQPVMLGWLRQRGHTESDANAGAERCVAALLATIGSAQGQWVLAPRPQAGAELALTFRDGARIATQVVDRCFVEDGVRWIIDYKTARIDGGEAALRAHAERYRPQLERYAALFAHEGLPLRMAIFYAASGHLLELRDTH
jgi:ATP-dependent exoDNAse (exonuclease V) beta subunit